MRAVDLKVEFDGNPAELLSFLTARLEQAGITAGITKHSRGVTVAVDTADDAWSVCNATRPSFEAA